MNLYYYRAICTSIYDGDTITAAIDLGFNTWLQAQKIRLYGIDTPEIRGPERKDGLEVKDWLQRQFINAGTDEFILKSYKDKTGKFGRWLGEIYLPIRPGAAPRNVNVEMIAKGLAKAYLP